MEYNDLIQSFYLVYYGRYADQDGLEYWNGRLSEDGADTQSIMDAFGTSDEWIANSADETVEEIVSGIYSRAFGREPDTEGLEYYVGELLSGSFTLVEIAVYIIDGAIGQDAVYLQNMVDNAPQAEEVEDEFISDNSEFFQLILENQDFFEYLLNNKDVLYKIMSGAHTSEHSPIINYFLDESFTRPYGDHIIETDYPETVKIFQNGNVFYPPKLHVENGVFWASATNVELSYLNKLVEYVTIIKEITPDEGNITAFEFEEDTYLLTDFGADSSEYELTMFEGLTGIQAITDIMSTQNDVVLYIYDPSGVDVFL